MDTDIIYEHLQKNGYHLIPGFLSDISHVKEEVLALLKHVKDDGSYKFGKSHSLLSIKEQEADYPHLYNIFSSTWMEQLAQQYLETHPLSTEIFITNEYRNTLGIETNGILHFDKYHTFKYMLYLSDCDRSSGAFSCIPGSHLHGKRLRLSSWKKTKVYNALQNKPLQDYPELGYSEKDVIPLEGKAGTLIIFDTDMFHRGGLIEDGQERLLVRSHFHDGTRWKKEKRKKILIRIKDFFLKKVYKSNNYNNDTAITSSSQKS